MSNKRRNHQRPEHYEGGKAYAIIVQGVQGQISLQSKLYVSVSAAIDNVAEVLKHQHYCKVYKIVEIQL